MKRTRQVFAIVVVATALCVDHSAAAAPRVSPAGSTGSSLASAAGRWMNRLSRRLSHPIAIIAPVGTTWHEATRSVSPRTFADQSLGVHLAPLSPFQFRLPPPVA